jgi:RimJ/RimL family protein N-acetyltransferase
MSFRLERTEIDLRNTLPAEVDLIHSMESQPENSRFVMAYSPERHMQVIESSDEEHLTVCDKATGEIMGYVILAGLSNPHLSLELRRIVVQSKGRGIGRQAVQLIKQYCFEQLRFHRLWLDVYADNDRAIHLYRSEGFVEEGKLREIRKDGDQYRSMFLFSILENEWKAQNRA